MHLKGESAEWVDQKLEEEVHRGQLVRGTSPWGSAPFPTKEAPEHKRSRKRRLVVDYRRVNSRVKRSVYYCRRSSDVIGAAAGSAFYTFVDAAAGFNQLVNTRRARQVLAIVSRAGKFLPTCLTFGPVNGPDDFSYTVDRLYSAGSANEKQRYGTEWLAYVDDLTVRTGRVLDGRVLTDEEYRKEVQAAAKSANAASGLQHPAEALGELGFNPEGLGAECDARRSRRKEGSKHDQAKTDLNHPTRAEYSVCTVRVSPRNNVLARRKKARVVSFARVCQSFCVLPALLSVSVFVFPELVSSGWCGLSRSSSGSSSTPFSRCSSWFGGCSFRTCLFEVVYPQPFSVLSPPVMGRRDREEGFLGRDPEALTSRRDRGRSRSTARLPSTQRVQTDRGIMDTRTSQQARDPSRGGHAGSAARADEGGHDRRHGSRCRSQRSSEENRLWSISKSLTSMLRHGNGGASGVLSSSGWASASRLCGLRYLRNLGAEVTDLVDIVRSQDSRKRRFEMIRDDHGTVYVRAVQGHSEGSGVAVAAINPEVDRDALPSFLLHCTFRRHLDSILNNGLLAGGDRGEAHRLQVHYVDGFPVTLAGAFVQGRKSV